MAILRRFLFGFVMFLATPGTSAANHQLSKNELNKIFVGTWLGNLTVRDRDGKITYQSTAELTRNSIATEDVRLLLHNGSIVESATVIRFEDGAIVLMGEHGIRRLLATHDGDTYALIVSWESSYKGRPRYGTAEYLKSSE